VLAPGSGKTLYIGSTDTSMYALNAATGAKQWNFSTGSYVYSTPALTPDGAALYFGSRDHSVYGLDASSGAMLWNFSTGDGVMSSPTLSEDSMALYIGSWDNNVWAIATGWTPSAGATTQL